MAFKYDLVLKYCYHHGRLLLEGQHAFLVGEDCRTVAGYSLLCPRIYISP